MQAMRHLLLLVVTWMSGLACAAGLQVSPVTLTLEADQQADGVWLSNTSGAQLDAQIRVYRWTQQDGQERLELTRELMVSPPMLKLAPQARQLVRLIRSGPASPGTAEVSYRVLIDELPLPQPGDGKTLNFVMRHSLPIFVLPEGARPSPPRLEWSLRREGEQIMLEVANGGGTHAQLAELVFMNEAGARTAVHSGLLGYVLPGASMRWPLRIPAEVLDAQGRWQVMINGNTLTQEIALPRRPG